MAKYKFELFGRLRKKAPPAPTGIPTERVRGMLAQGISESDIIAALKTEGYAFEQIDEALTRAAMEAAPPTAVPPAAPQAPEAVAYAPAAPPISAAAPPAEFYTPPEAREEVPRGEELLPLERPPPTAPAPEAARPEYSEELIEQLVAEKMSALESRFIDIDEKSRGAAARLDDLANRVTTLSKQIKETSEGLRRDLSDATAKISEVEPRIASLERAFKEIVPNLVDTVREVRELVIRARLKTEEERPAEL